MIIYVSGPYSKGDSIVNVRNACLVGDELYKRGHHPVIPHLTALWHAISPRSYEEWLDIDMAIIPRMDAVFRISGESKGADMEVRLARKLKIPVYYNLDELSNGG